MKLVFIIPVHNQEKILEQTFAQVTAFLQDSPESEILFVENKSRDRSREILQRIERAYHSPRVRFTYLDEAGLGLAYRNGMLRPQPPNSWVILTACDLPFGFSDVKSFQSSILAGKVFDIAIGSKFHPHSQVSRSFARSLMTKVFWLLRKLVLGMKTRDCQGSFFIRSELCSALLPLIQSNDFFFTTELCYVAEQQKLRIQEMPIRFEEKGQASTVRLFSDTKSMLRQLLLLRFRAPLGAVRVLVRPRLLSQK